MQSPAPNPITMPTAAVIEDDQSILVMPLAHRRRAFRRRRQMVNLREWVALAGMGGLALLVTCIAVVSFLAH